MYVYRDETRTVRQYYVIHSHSEKSVYAVRMRSSSNRIMDNILRVINRISIVCWI